MSSTHPDQDNDIIDIEKLSPLSPGGEEPEADNVVGFQNEDDLEGFDSHGASRKAEANSLRKTTTTNSLKQTATNKSIAETLPLWREILFVGAVCTSQFMTQGALNQVLVLLHPIGNSFHITDPGVLSWFAAGYSLTVGTFILLAGRLGDVFGYKKMMLIGYLWFALWTLITGFSVWSNKVLFIFARVLAGIGPAICLPNGLALLGATYAPGKRKALIFSLFGACAPVGAWFGALFAAIWNYLWWPWAFWTFGIGLLVITALGVIVIPSPPRKVEIKRCTWHMLFEELDLYAGSVGVVALVLFNFAWNQAPIVGWQKAYIIVTLILGVAFALVFFYLEIKVSREPLIPFSALNADTAFVLACVSLGWSSFGIWIYYFYQFVQVIRKDNLIVNVAYVAPVIISGTCASILTGWLIGKKVKPAVLMTIAMCAFCTGNILIGTAGVRESYWAQLFVAAIVTPFGMDMSFPAATLILSDALPRKKQGVGASLVNTLVNYSISMGLGIAGTVEVQVNKGGRTPADVLFGYRAAYWVGIGLAGLGIFVSLCFVARSYWVEAQDKKHGREPQKNEEAEISENDEDMLRPEPARPATNDKEKDMNA